MTTRLRQKLMEGLLLHGVSGRTSELYMLAVEQLAKHNRKPLEQISEAELRS